MNINRATDDKVDILLVDDQPSKLLTYEAILGDLGENLIKARSAHEALDSLLKRDVAVILVDVCMPELDGFELASMIRGHPRFQKTAIILVSAVLLSDLDRLKGYGSGAVDYVPVPVVPEILRAKVSVFVDLYRKGRQLERSNQELERRVLERTSELQSSLGALATSEERFRVALQNSRITVSNQDADLRYIWVYNSQLGIPAEAMLGKTDNDLFPGDQAAVLTALKRGVLRTGKGVREEMWLSIHDRDLCFDLTIEPLRGGHGEPVGITCAAVDVTERRRLEEALRDADRRKDEFLATLAHELRNPLAAVSHAAEVIRLKGPADSEMRWSQDVIHRQVDHLKRLIDDLLDVGRITQNKLQLRKERFDLRALLQATAEGIRSQAEQQGQELAVLIPDEPLTVSADATRLAQVFQNLLDNAVKYTRAGGHITLTVERHGNEVIASVEDTGIGISPDHLPHLFEMFFQADRSLERASGGLGIGLSLVRLLVGLHGGHIEARSQGLGRGSEFVVRLPLDGVAPMLEAVMTETVQEKGSMIRRILVADDNLDSAESMAIALRLMGHNVQTAHDGLAAVEAAERDRPDVVLLDLGMPRMNGYDACRRIREMEGGQRIVVIAQTGWGQEEDQSRTRAAGFDGHLTKPADFDVLEKLLANLPER
ncbi:MAG TPA: response regulator [Candidatus Polarisedimenticolia bacterium]|nr:response regulator [Candidatus Polarisedimenticolia bacterium]